MTVVTADLRWLRAVVVAAVALTLGVSAHTLAGGMLPSTGALLTLLVGLTGVSAAVLGRPASYAVIVGVVAGGQVVVHLTLSGSLGAGGDPHHVAMSDGATSTHVPMLLGHAAAAALVAAWLWTGERAVWGLVALVGRHAGSAALRLTRVDVPHALAPRRPRAPTSYAVSAERAQRSPSRGQTARRGPPSGRTPSLAPVV